jgi:hypothetical protein
VAAAAERVVTRGRGRMRGVGRRLLSTLPWAVVLGVAFRLAVPPLDALGEVLVLPPSYHLGLRLLLGALWLVGTLAIFVHADDGSGRRTGA